ncbi:MAG: hypothetical protein QXT06_08145 [Candidatus Bathyarchaeia archaeon]
MSSISSKFDGVAVAFAAVVAATGSYSTVDRLANAMSGEVVAKATYEVARILTVIKDRVRVCEEAGRPYTEVKDREDRLLRIPGKLASYSELDNFVEEATKDLLLARRVAAKATYKIVDVLLKEEGG